MDPFDTLRALGALILVLGIIFGLAWALQRYGSRFGMRGDERPNNLRVVEWRALDTRRKLAVVRWGDTEHLLCIGPAGDCVVAQRPAREETPTAAPTPESQA